MTFKARISCDAMACLNEVELTCAEPAFAEDAMFCVIDESGWFSMDGYYHYCPEHAKVAQEELLNEKE